MRPLISRFGRDETAATAIEYGLIAMLIAVVIIGGVGVLGVKLDEVYQSISGQFEDAGTG